MPRDHSGRRLAVEGLVIVVSILAAFGIQALWEDRGEREEEQRLLTSLLEEGQLALAQIDTNMVFHQVLVASTKAILSAPLSETAAFSADSLDHLIANLEFARSVDFQTGTLNTILLGGRLAVIDSPELRESVVGWEGALAEIADVAKQDFERDVNNFREYLREHATLAQLSNALPNSPGSSEPLVQEQIPLPTGRQDHFELLRQTPFRNLVLQRRWAQEDLLHIDNGYPGLRRALLRLMASIEDEIQDAAGG